MYKYCLKHIENKYKSIFAVYMYISIFMVHLFFCSCSFVWSLGFRNIYSVEKMYIFIFCYSICFSSFAFFFSWTTLHFFKCLLYFVGLFRSNVLSLHRGQRILKLFFGFFSLFSCFCFFLVLLLFLHVFVLTLLVDFFLFYCFSLFTDYVLLVHQHLYSVVLEYTLFPFDIFGV